MTVDEILRRAADELVADVRATTDPEAALDQIVESPPPIRRRWLPVAAALVVVLGLATLAVVVWSPDGDQGVDTGPSADGRPSTAGPPTGESAGVPMTVDPAAGLEEGDRLQVTADELPPGETVVLLLCPADALVTGEGASACDGPLGAEAVADPSGRVEAPFVVDRLLNGGGDGEPLDCARDVRCAVGVGVEVRLDDDSSRYDLRGLVAIELAPREALERPTIEVAPADDLRHGDVVTVTGEHFAGRVGTGMICTEEPEEECAFTAIGEVGVDEDGRFEAEVPMWRMVLGDGPDGLVDCAAVGCTFVVIGPDGRSSEPVDLGFDPDAPRPVVPTIDVTPRTGIRPGDPLTFTATGLSPGDEVDVMACRSEADGWCGIGRSITTFVAGAEGRATATVVAEDPAALLVESDCTTSGACAVAMGFTFGSDPVVSAARPVPIRYAPP